jgi:hypothetical protein
MKFKTEKTLIPEEVERALESDVRSLAGSRGLDILPQRPDVYWANLPVRINARIDKATSGKAMSISWALRVALPGVVAIVSFFIGLHYYVSDIPEQGPSIRQAVMSLPQASLDSMLMFPSRVDPAISIEDLDPDVFEISSDQIAGYLVSTGNVSAALEGLTGQETNEFIAALGNGSQ